MHTEGPELLQHVGVAVVIDKDTDGVVAGGQHDRGAVQTAFEEGEFDAAAAARFG